MYLSVGIKKNILKLKVKMCVFIVNINAKCNSKKFVMVISWIKQVVIRLVQWKISRFGWFNEKIVPGRYILIN